MYSSEPQDSGGWSFLQALTNTTNNNSQANDGNSYTTNDSFLRLSENSLQKCTEILGDETGSIVFESEEICTENNIPKRQKDSSKKNDQCKSLPPPLSSSGVLRIRPHRESGRLILQGPVHDDNDEEEEEEEETGSVVLENEEIRTDNNSPKKQPNSSSSKNNDEEECRSTVFPPPLSSTGVLHTRPHHGEGGGPILQPVPAHDEQETEEELDEQVLEKQEQEQEQLQEDEEK
ncbi:protein FANTASTIC FOUR 4-like [Quercus lobata]|uniref:Uncharacterized protein n=1 Tax=Quercus lobata TaxID=97700 RepID=A0A7N2N276_QUELO|nr:protein FANTASTIC FOUR 4-like [Quercus lobata]